MESTDSSAESQNPHLPPGFRFHPTDEELVVHYLKKKAAADPLPVSIIAEVDLYKFDPWELPAKAIFGEQEWYFFTPRDRKYPNGARPNRAATSGYWKATGTDKPVLTAGGAQKVGVKKALVFYAGKPPKGIKTSWIMHEYRLADGKAQPNKPPGYDNAKKASLRLDDWVLCRIYKKNNTTQRPVGHEGDPTTEMGLDSIHGLKPPSTYCSYLETEHDLYEQQGMTSNDINDNLCSSRSKPPSSLQFPFMDTSRNTLGKKMLQNFYWVDGGENGNSTSPRDKSFIVETCDASNSMINIMGQLSRAEDMETQVVIDSNVGDDVLRQSYQVSGMNWYD